MAQIIVRNLDDDVVARLKARARDNDRSLEAEVRHILEQSAKVDMAEALAGRMVTADGKFFQALCNSPLGDRML